MSHLSSMVIRLTAGAFVGLGPFALSACHAETSETAEQWQTMTVTASSYTLAASETHAGSVGIGAFGDRLEPGDKAIAVSRDLLKDELEYGTQVRIDGLPGTYIVLDKMNRRWQNKIDILFAKRQRALEWGVQTVEIEYRNMD